MSCSRLLSRLFEAFLCSESVLQRSLVQLLLQIVFKRMWECRQDTTIYAWARSGKGWALSGLLCHDNCTNEWISNKTWGWICLGPHMYSQPTSHAFTRLVMTQDEIFRFVTETFCLNFGVVAETIFVAITLLRLMFVMAEWKIRIIIVIFHIISLTRELLKFFRKYNGEGQSDNHTWYIGFMIGFNSCLKTLLVLL